MPGTLGRGRLSAAVYARGGQFKMLDLDKPSELQFSRTLSSPSAAFAIMDAARAAECFADLGKVHPWSHELVIFRNGERAWEGPIRWRNLGKSRVRLDAVDVVGWLSRRRIRVSRRTGEPHNVTEEGDLILTRALSPDDPNILAHVQVIDEVDNTPVDQSQITRDVRANSGYYIDDLATLTGQGLAYTTIGRRIVLWPSELLLARTEVIQLDTHLVADVSVDEAGDDLATRMTAVNNDGMAVTVDRNNLVAAEGVSEFYGLHDMLAPDTSDLKKAGGLRAAARRELSPRYPTPQLVTVPSGSQVDCDAPLPLEQLVAGVSVPVETNVTATKISADMVLAEVVVNHKADAGEVVTVSLVPWGDLDEVSA